MTEQCLLSAWCMQLLPSIGLKRTAGEDALTTLDAVMLTMVLFLVGVVKELGGRLR